MTSRITWLAALSGLAALLCGFVVPASSSPLRGTTAVLRGAHNDTSTPFNLTHLPSLARDDHYGRGLRLTRVLRRELAFTRYAVTYRSDSLTIGGVMNVPTRPGRSPLVVVAHGYADPARYRSGSMLEREQAALAMNGFVAFQIDYRNYARSSRESGRAVAHPLGYASDLVNAVRAVKRARLPFVDPRRIGLLGRSMGGGVALNALVAEPGLADALVLYSPVSSQASETYRRWVRPHPGLRARVERAYGTPRTRPEFWAEASSRRYLHRLRVPVQIHHGTADPVCPLRWSEATAAALRAAGKDVRLFRYPREEHRIDAGWTRFMHRTVTFFRAELR